MSVEYERALVRRILSGDQAAFEQLVADYERRVYAMALRAAQNEQDALDLSQEIFLKLYRSLPGFQFRSGLATWIYRIAGSVCTDFLRARRARPVAESLSGSEAEDLPDRELPDERWSPERAAQQQAARDALEHGLRRLSPEHRQVLLLREVEGLTYDEIAARLALSPGTVKSRIARARGALCTLLRAEGNFFAPEPSNAPSKQKGGGSYAL